MDKELLFVKPGTYEVKTGIVPTPSIQPLFTATNGTHESLIRAMFFWPGPERGKERTDICPVLVYDPETGEADLLVDVNDDRAPRLSAKLINPKDLLGWKLNGEGWMATHLAHHMRFNQHMMVDCISKEVIDSLMEFHTTIKKDIEIADSADGQNRGASIKREIIVKRNPKPFTVKASPYVGQEPVTFQVFIRYEESREQHQVLLYLECLEYKQLEEMYRQSLGTKLQDACDANNYLYLEAGKNAIEIPNHAFLSK